MFLSPGLVFCDFTILRLGLGLGKHKKTLSSPEKFFGCGAPFATCKHFAGPEAQKSLQLEKKLEPRKVPHQILYNTVW